MATKIDTVTARDKLLARDAPYWAKIRDKCHLGFRMTTPTSTGTWQVRFNDEAGKVQQHTLGSFDGFPANRRYDEALKEANKWFEHRSSGGSATNITVAQACERYVTKQRDQKKELTARDLEGRYKRWIYSDQKLSNTPVIKLVPKQLYEWRIRLSNTPAILQDKSKIAVKQRAASTINRDMASFKAALNQAVSDGYAATSTAWSTHLAPIKGATQNRKGYLNESERNKLIAHCPLDLKNFVKALSLLPVRPGAMSQLTVNDYDSANFFLTIVGDKAGQGRKFSIPPETASFFYSQTKDKIGDEPLFARADGKFWNKDSWKGPFKTAVKAAGLPIATTAYTLRHSTITDMIMISKSSISLVAKVAGTSVAMIEKHYSHLLQDQVSNALAFLKVD